MSSWPGESRFPTMATFGSGRACKRDAKQLSGFSRCTSPWDQQPSSAKVMTACSGRREGGSLIPKASPLAKRLRKEYPGDCDELPLFREGHLFNMYLKQDGPCKLMNSLVRCRHGRWSSRCFRCFRCWKLMEYAQSLKL